MKNNKAKSKLKKIILPMVVAVTIIATLCISLVVGNRNKNVSSNSDYQAKIEKLSTQNELLHKDKVALNTQISELANQVSILSTSNDNYKNQIATLSTQKTSLENQVSELKILKSQNETKINELNLEIDSLKNEILDLELSNEDKTTRIAILNNRVVNLEALVEQLEDINAMHLVTISSLNSQIATLNSQIQNLSVQLFENSNTMDSYLKRIAELEKSIAYYDTFVSAMESDTKAVVTFEYNNSVYNIQVVNKNSLVSVVSPSSTNYVVFNGWTINGQSIDLSTYEITESVRVVADVTYKYDVNFVVDGADYDSQIVESSSFATLPTTPTKDGYVFDGWTVDGITIENVNEYQIVRNTTFTAKFTKMHQVTFSYEDTILSTQSIRNGAFANVVSTPADTEYKVFNGWKVDGIIVDVTTYTITKDTNFIAEIVEWCDVNFMVDSAIYDIQRVELNTYATIPTAPTKTGYVFAGWTLNGTDVIDITTNLISSHTTYIARFEELFDVTFRYEDTIISEQSILNGFSPTSVSTPADTERKIFNGWLVNGEMVDDITKYVVTQDTTFVADITYKYLVTYVSEGLTLSSNYVTKDTTSTAPTSPTKVHYAFVGWSVDGINVVDTTTYSIVSDTEFVAIFEPTFIEVSSRADSSSSFVGSSIGKSNDLTSYSFDISDYGIDYTKWENVTKIDFDLTLYFNNIEPVLNNYSYKETTGKTSTTLTFSFTKSQFDNTNISMGSVTFNNHTFDIEINDLNFYNTYLNFYFVNEEVDGGFFGTDYMYYVSDAVLNSATIYFD